MPDQSTFKSDYDMDHGQPHKLATFRPKDRPLFHRNRFPRGRAFRSLRTTTFGVTELESRGGL
jgi:hypothetical protein